MAKKTSSADGPKPVRKVINVKPPGSNKPRVKVTTAPNPEGQ